LDLSLAGDVDSKIYGRYFSIKFCIKTLCPMKKLILAILLIINGLNIMAQCPAISSAWDTHTESFTTFSPYAIATDDLGNVFIAGYFNTSASFNNGVLNISASGGTLFVVKYDKFGNTQWAINAGANSQYDEILGITVKPDGSEIFVTGHFSSPVSFGINTLTPMLRCIRKIFSWQNL
jgi:hypothetical protein